MNYLAHALLSKRNIDYQIGNLLADPLKGRKWSDATDFHISGMKMHAAIDAFTDSNDTVFSSKFGLGRKGHLKGVVIDVVYDHFLTKHWDKFSIQDFEVFVNNFNCEAPRNFGNLPCEASRFIENIASHNILGSYRDLSGVEVVFNRIDKRLSERVLKKESTISYMNAVESNYEAIEKDFLLFFPQLISMFLEKSNASIKEHYFK